MYKITSEGQKLIDDNATGSWTDFSVLHGLFHEETDVKIDVSVVVVHVSDIVPAVLKRILKIDLLAAEILYPQK